MKKHQICGILALGFVLIAVVATGCSGIHATKSISPLDFILPGLLQNGPPSPVAPFEINSVPLLAQAPQFLQVENQMAIFVDLNIASEMPVVGSAPQAK